MTFLLLRHVLTTVPNTLLQGPHVWGQGIVGATLQSKRCKEHTRKRLNLC